MAAIAVAVGELLAWGAPAYLIALAVGWLVIGMLGHNAKASRTGEEVAHGSAPARPDAPSPLAALGGSVLGLTTDGAALILCAHYVPRFTLTPQGFAIALLVMTVPTTVAAQMVRRLVRDHGRGPRAGLALVSAVFGTGWMFAGPLVADQASPDFNIGGFWQYAFLLAASFALTTGSGHLVRGARHAAERLRT